MLKLMMVLFTVIVCAVAIAGDDFLLKGGHMESELQCVDCHATDKPEKKANQASCKGCHGDMADSGRITFKDSNGKSIQESVHNSHAGQIRCTLCHSVHSVSQLYCNTGCHHDFDIKVP